MKLQLMGASVLVLTALTATQVYAQAPAAPADGGAVDAIVVTGTRTTGLRAVDSAAPVQVLGNDILKRTGSPALLQSLAQNIPSLQAQAFGSDEAEFNLEFKLRGLSPNQTLVLVDGKRRHGTANVAVSGGPYGGGAAPDLSFIPTAAIDHVEVLTDGAAAQYGTDAIAGVVNIILKKNTHGGNFSYTGGQYMDGGGLTSDANGTIGLAPNDQSFLDLSFESKFQGHSFRGDVDPRVLNTGTPGNVSANVLPRFPGMTSFPGYPYSNYIEGDGQVMLDTVTFNSGYDVSPNLQLYSFGSVGYKDGRAYENYRLANVAVGPQGQIPYPAGFAPQENIRETDYALTVGGKGTIQDTTWDLSSTYGRNYDRVYVIGSINAGLFAATGDSQRNFHDGDFTSTELTNNLDLTHAFNVGMAEPMVLAGGAEYRIDSYEIKAGDPESYSFTGAQSFEGYAPSNAGYHQRSNYSFYLDDAITPIKSWKVDAAVRYENYTDFGNTTVGKLTSRYDFNDAIAIRGTASTGFRAPTLGEEYYSGINVGPTSVSGVFAPNSAGAALLGIGGLKPEKSTNFSVGFVTHFLPALTMTIDAYSIKVTDRIVQSGTFYGYNTNKNVVTSPAVLAALAGSNVNIDPAIFTVSSASVGVQTFVNGVDTQTYGVDYLATYSKSYGDFGHVDWSLSANYDSTQVTKVAPPPSKVSQSVVILDQAAISGIEDATPKWRATFNAYWTLGRFSANLRESIYGSSFEYAQDPVGAQFDQIKINTAAITDLEVGMDVIHNVKLSLGANNLLNTYPTKEPSGFRQGQFNTNSSSYASSLYPSFSPFGFNGGYYYGRVTWTF
jgi:iron complex outermembrane receptor protein